MSKRVIILTLAAGVAFSLLLVRLTPATAQEAVPPTQPATASAPTTQGDPMAGLSFDLKKKTVTVQCKVSLAEGPVEFLLCRNGTKEYESILSTNAIPSSIHGLLLAMGLTPGKPARTIYPDGEQAQFLPPRGPGLKITARWKDDDNKAHEINACDLLAFQQAGEKDKKPAMPETWVFVGSDTLSDGSYWADREGDVISVANFGASVIDVPFESSNKNAGLAYKVNAKTTPAKGTSVELVIEVLPGAEREPHARVLVEVDRFGRFHVDGKPLNEDQLTEWASQFTQNHPKTEVSLRLDERAWAGDIVRAQDALKLGGIWDVNQQILRSAGPSLPRTPDEAKDSLTQWAKKFERGQRLTSDPVEDAEQLLQDVRRQMAETEAIQTMLKEYAQQITQGLEKYKASTQPAKPAQPAPQ